MRNLRFKLLIVCIVVGLFGVVRADDDDYVMSGVDCWMTVDPTFLVFGSEGLPEIPAGFFFFEPGSEPFSGTVYLRGSTENGPDTQILRVTDGYLPPPYPSSGTVETEMVSLNLVSVEPITVHYEGLPDSFFDVYVTLRPDIPSPGSMNITKTQGGGGSGGSINSVIVSVNVVFQFTNTKDPAEVYFLERTLDDNGVYSGAHPWKKEAEKEVWPCFDNDFYPYGKEALVLVYGLGVGQQSLVAPQRERAYFSISSFDEWNDVNSPPAAGPGVAPMDSEEWAEYMYHWQSDDPDIEKEGDPYPENEFMPAELYVWEGGGEPWVDPCTGEPFFYPEDAGLVMVWGNEDPPEGSWSSAWKYKYSGDPDLRNSIIKVSVTAPSGCGINIVSFAIEDGAKLRRSWQWNVPGTIAHNKSTTVTIDPSIRGVGAATPKADGYRSHKNFNLANSLFFDVDENANWVFGKIGVPAPGKMVFVGMWNYWHNLIVMPKPPREPSKFFIKWSQRPVPIDANYIHDFNGWNELSDPCYRPVLADDWLCEDERPVTDIHWWGSFLGWHQPHMPPVVPQAFHLGIWTDDPCDFPGDISHPDIMIWENFCDNWVWNFAGHDIFPWVGDPCQWPKETCFQFNQLLSEDEWFKQDPNAPWDFDDDPNSTVYWLSIYPIYNPWDYPLQHPWGWKTRPHFYNDDAYRIWDVEMPPVDWPAWITLPANWPPRVWSRVILGDPIWWPTPDVSWDLAFELTTNVPAYEDNPIPGDLNGDGIVNFLDFVIFANNWLKTAP